MAKKSTEQTRAERTAALMKEQQRAERRRQLNVVVSVMAVLAVVVGVGVWLMSRSDETSNSTVSDSEYALVVGPDDAATKVVIYEDFLCPACAYFESITSEKLQAAADAGKVQIEYRPFFFLQQFGDYSARAANAFRAVWVDAGPEAAKEFHDAIFADQPAESGPFPDDDWLVQHAVDAGADEAKVRPAIEDMEYQKWVDQATKEASIVRATPTVYVDGEILETSTLDEKAAQLFTMIG
jgi:protein-disulfide isomerase